MCERCYNEGTRESDQGGGSRRVLGVREMREGEREKGRESEGELKSAQSIFLGAKKSYFKAG